MMAGKWQNRFAGKTRSGKAFSGYVSVNVVCDIFLQDVRLAKEGNWRQLARQLKLSDMDLTCLSKIHDLSEIYNEMLQYYISREGRKANLKEVVHALHGLSFRYLVETIQQRFPNYATLAFELGGNEKVVQDIRNNSSNGCQEEEPENCDIVGHSYPGGWPNGKDAPVCINMEPTLDDTVQDGMHDISSQMGNVHFERQESIDGGDFDLTFLGFENPLDMSADKNVVNDSFRKYKLGLKADEVKRYGVKREILKVKVKTGNPFASKKKLLEQYINYCSHDPDVRENQLQVNMCTALVPKKDGNQANLIGRVYRGVWVGTAAFVNQVWNG